MSAHDSSQPGMGQAFGSGVIIDWQGQKYQVDSFTIEDWGKIEHELLLRKRNDIMRLVNAQFGQLPREVWDEKYEQSRQAANALQSIPDEELTAFLNTSEGICLFFWVLLERRYPGRFKYDEMLGVAYQFSQHESKMSEMIQLMSIAAGLGGGQKNPTSSAA